MIGREIAWTLAREIAFPPDRPATLGNLQGSVGETQTSGWLGAILASKLLGAPLSAFVASNFILPRQCFVCCQQFDLRCTADQIFPGANFLSGTCFTFAACAQGQGARSVPAFAQRGRNACASPIGCAALQPTAQRLPNYNSAQRLRTLKSITQLTSCEKCSLHLPWKH